MGLMAFGANETPIELIVLVDLLLIFLCQAPASAVWPAFTTRGRREGLWEFRIL